MDPKTKIRIEPTSDENIMQVFRTHDGDEKEVVRMYVVTHEEMDFFERATAEEVEYSE